VFSIFGLWKFPILSKLTGARITWANVVNADQSYGELPFLNTNTLVLTKDTPNYLLYITKEIDVTFTWSTPTTQGKQILYYTPGPHFDTAYMKIVFSEVIDQGGELKAIVSKIYTQSLGIRTGPGGHIPDGTGPYGIGVGPGAGRRDGSGYRR